MGHTSSKHPSKQALSSPLKGAVALTVLPPCIQAQQTFPLAADWTSRWIHACICCSPRALDSSTGQLGCLAASTTGACSFEPGTQADRSTGIQCSNHELLPAGPLAVMASGACPACLEAMQTRCKAQDVLAHAAAVPSAWIVVRKTHMSIR